MERSPTYRATLIHRTSTPGNPICATTWAMVHKYKPRVHWWTSWTSHIYTTNRDTKNIKREKNHIRQLFNFSVSIPCNYQDAAAPWPTTDTLWQTYLSLAGKTLDTWQPVFFAEHLGRNNKYNKVLIRAENNKETVKDLYTVSSLPCPRTSLPCPATVVRVCWGNLFLPSESL